MFRERDTSPAIRMAWTDPDYHNGWLARPRGGKIESLADLFGNFTPQPPSDHPNGYSALAFWANQEGCGKDLDHLDAQNCMPVWKKLRVWTDSNHDGIAQSEELHTLEELDVRRISLVFRESWRVDQYGNRFRYTSTISDEMGRKDNRTYDVFLVTEP